MKEVWMQVNFQEEYLIALLKKYREEAESEIEFAGEKVRGRLQFVDLTTNQLAQLEYFLENRTDGVEK